MKNQSDPAIQLSNDDVIHIESEGKPLGLSNTFKSGRLIDNLSKYLARYSEATRELLEKGLECEVLQPNSEWQQGRLQIIVTFTPGTINKLDDSLSESEYVEDIEISSEAEESTTSSLDHLRTPASNET